LLARAGTWIGNSAAGAISNGRWWFYQEFAAASGPGITITTNENGTGLSFSAANIVNNSAVVTDQDGNPVYTSATSTPATLVIVSAHTAAAVTLSAAPHASYGILRVWYLYTASTGSLPSDMEVAPHFVIAARVEWIDSNFLNQNLNLSDLPNASTARTNLGFSAITAGQVLLGDGGTLPTSDSALFFNTTSDCLGVGTILPLARAHLNDSGAAALYLKVTNSVSGVDATDGFDVGIDASANAILLQRENLAMIFSTNNTEVARFNADGTFLIKQGIDFEDTDAGTNKVRIQASTSLAVDWTLTLPVNDGDANQFLQTNGSGVTTWASASPGIVTTKGDLYTYAAADARLAVGTSFGQILTVDATQTTGLAWGPVVKSGSNTMTVQAITKAVTFANANPMPSANYSLTVNIANYTDASPIRQLLTSIVKTTAGFTVEWDSPLDSANYILEWQVIGHTS
tara:strand:- start:4906 stop:6279 length:1374 start_codon:yes stop_codon:yes gene_type:complete